MAPTSIRPEFPTSTPEVVEIENRYDCPGGLWKKMSDKRKIAYNNMRSHKRDIVIPDYLSDSITEAQWECISHNFAYLAACEID